MLMFNFIWLIQQSNKFKVKIFIINFKNIKFIRIFAALPDVATGLTLFNITDNTIVLYNYTVRV